MSFLCHLAICLFLVGSPLPVLGSLVALTPACPLCPSSFLLCTLQPSSLRM